MRCIRKITNDIYSIGANDRRIALFENIYPVPAGVSYNSYLIKDDKTVLIDTVDKSVRSVFLDNLKAALEDRTLDYLIVNHMEPDHCAVIADVHRIYPNVKIICNAKTVTMLKQFFEIENLEVSINLVKEGDTLDTGKHQLTFVMAPMVHWPEVMVTYDLTENILFSADAFGTFGALNGNIFTSDDDITELGISEYRRYYTNIVGKYGAQVQMLLKKVAKLPIKMLCPLHGPIWKDNINIIVEKYARWSSYTPEINGVLVLYGSIYGGTENAAEILASSLSEKGVKNIAIYDVSVTGASYIVAEAFKYSHIVFASATYNAGIFTPMENVINDLRAHNLQNRAIAIIENGSWAATAGGLIKKELEAFKNCTILNDIITIKSTVKASDKIELEALAEKITESVNNMNQEASVIDEAKIDNTAFFKLGYGLYALITKDQNGKNNACIVNTVIQATDSPKRLLVIVNKSNYTNETIQKTGYFNISTLTQSAPFSLFEHFGFQSGKDVDKFEDFKDYKLSENGLPYIDKHSNSYFSCRVISSEDCGTHTIFVAQVVESIVLNNDASVTYDYYFKEIKPAPQKPKKKGYVCKICGYVYEGDTLPEDFVCPLCKHGASDFEPIE